MKKWLWAAIGCVLLATSCARYGPAPELPGDGTTQEAGASADASQADKGSQGGKTGGQAGSEEKPASIQIENHPLASKRQPVKVKGIYISGRMAGAGPHLKEILDQAQKTEINAVVVDVKDDDGRVTFAMDHAPVVTEVGAVEPYIKDIGSFIKDLKARGFYVIGRVVAFRDPYLAEKKPEWSLKDKDGKVHRDNKGLAWVNPYKKEVWDYLVEVGSQAAKAGFDEIQFDYIRFATDSTMKNVVFDQADTQGRSKEDVITEFIKYAYGKLSRLGVFVSADVFGTIIGSQVDAAAVGQDYQVMASNLDYICPMIYPSHYGDGNFGIAHPDTQPYDTILAALQGSRQHLEASKQPGGHQAVVRPWLQDFTANYLKTYIPYGAKEVRAEIQAVYDAGYDQWILWSAANKYTWDALLTKEQAKEEEKKIAQSRAALPPETSQAKPKPTQASQAKPKPTQAKGKATSAGREAASGKPAN